jgi:hypothetical protein
MVPIGPDPARLDGASEVEEPARIPAPDTGAEAIEHIVGIESASSSPLKVVTETTGPKISSWKT